MHTFERKGVPARLLLWDFNPWSNGKLLPTRIYQVYNLKIKIVERYVSEQHTKSLNLLQNYCLMCGNCYFIHRNQTVQLSVRCYCEELVSVNGSLDIITF